MNWSWGVFFIALVVCTILSQLARGAMNGVNVAKHGPRADYKAEPGMAILGSIVAGAVYATIITAVAGFIF
ncbi:hypothetical protein [Bradyrhizobium australafricanum]|uniref:hypothetical protein n=1 Tax=Bradyrhizobium australafricanum TaxID=2821406 RepID=UPI001CE24F81|nr:hypothetical protein [Bradyrhizobium australafricanum]MCA6104741.1 hypothetical protein [Bradyrhizobium australafricanum]